MRRPSRWLAACVTAAAMAFVLAGSAGAQSVTNGSFETGDFTGWTVENQPGGSGDWYVYSGTISPVSGMTIAPPPHGTYAAVSDQGGPGSHVLYQTLTAAPGLVLEFEVYYENWAGVFYTPPTLDYTVIPNQQYRVDIMHPAAPVFSVAPGDVLANVFQTDPGEPTSLGPTTVRVPLWKFAGGSCGRPVVLRFAEVDNQFFFNASVDNVRIRVVKPAPQAPCIAPPAG